MKDRGLLISLSIIIGILLSCVMLPLGGLALLLLSVDGSNTTSGMATPPRTWNEQIVSGGTFDTGQDRVLIIEINGVIGVSADSLLNETLSQRELLSQIDQAKNDPNIRAVVVRVDSPGGGVVASDEIHDALVELRESGTTLVVSMGSIAASGGYYVAAPAERIYANADTLTGSLGVIITLLNYEETFDMVGLQQRVFKSGEFKDIGSPTRDLSNDEEEILQDIVDQAYEGFVDVIAEGRNLSRERVLELADGRIYTGEQALEAELVDELGNLDAAIDGARDMAGLPENALVVRYNATPGLFDLLNASVQNGQRPADPLGLRTLREPPELRLEYRMVP